MITTATIFYNDAKWVKNISCFDSRFDGSILPSGSVVAGFLVREGREIKELLDPPHMSPEQEENWQQVLGEARGLLLGLPVALQ